MSRDIGIDFGTANVLIHLKGRGIVLHEPAVVAVDSKTQEVIAYGQEAYDMMGRTSDAIEIIHPLKGGVIADFDLAEAMLVLFLNEIHSSSWFTRPNVLISTPSQISEIERHSLMETVEKAGGGKIYIEEEPKVAAVGSGMNLSDPSGNMVIDIGGGTSDMAILARGEIISSQSLKLAGDDFDEAIIQYFKDKYKLLVGRRTAEQAKMEIASAIELPESQVEVYDLKGRDLITGLPKSINIDSNDLYYAIQDQLAIIARTARSLLEDAEPEITSDIMETGIILTGGGAMIYGLDTYLTEELKVSVLKAEQPMNSVAIGTGLMLELIQSGQLERSHPTRKQQLARFFRRLKRRLIG